MQEVTTFESCQRNGNKSTETGDGLTKYHKSLVRQLVNRTAYGNIKTLTNIQFMLGFSDHQISLVVENFRLLFSLSDFYNYVQIWDKQHALKILSIIDGAFGDGNEENQSCYLLSDDNDDNIFDDELLDEQNEILQDEFSVRYMLQMGPVVPSAALETTETINFGDE